MKSVSLKQRLARKKSLKKIWMQKKYVSKQGRTMHGYTTVQKIMLLIGLDDDEIDQLWRLRDAQKIGGQDMWCMREGKGRKRKEVLLTTPTLNLQLFGDDETIAQVLNMSQAKAVLREKEKGGMKKIEEDESDTESRRHQWNSEKKLRCLLFDEESAGKLKIKGMNEGAKDLEQKRLMKKVAKETPNKGDTAKVPAKVDVTEQDTKKRKGGHMKMLARKRKRPQSDVDSDDEHRKVSEVYGDYLVIYRANGNFKAFNYLLEVLYIFDRQDLFHLYDLVMNQYSEVTMEGIKLILWGDLKILMESSKEENDKCLLSNNQQNGRLSL
ncbi:hypothetical protein Tco_1301987 [Tanacetum coccineum]